MLGAMAKDTKEDELAETAVDGDARTLPSSRLSRATEETFADRYETRGSLGVGGMGEVRLCEDIRIGRTVALKVIRDEHGDDSGIRRRFEREARVQAQLEHPAIVPVYDIGVGRDGQTYFTMKRVRGLTLAEALSGLADGNPDMVAKYSRHRLLTTFQNVCNAIAFAHSRGVVHRDLKPANVMLGEFGEVNVLDWGIAKWIDESESPGESAASPAEGETRAGTIVGTPGYMAPEQAMGRAVDGRADIYALGAILFELLTLEPLHAGSNAQALLASTLEGTPADADGRAPNAQVPPELNAICERATRFDPEDRFANARELAGAIERFLEGDRDLERRRAQATTHYEKGAALVAKATTGDIEARAGAVHELGRALALDPEHRRALAAMIELLLTVPPDLPVEAREELDASGEDRRQALNRDVVRVMMVLAGLLVVVLAVWIGVGGVRVHSAAQLATTIGGWIGIALVNAIGNRIRVVPEWLTLIGIAATYVMIASTAWLFGPLILLPSVVVAVTLSVMTMFPRAPRLRTAGLFFGLGAIVVPVACETLGLIAPSYSFDGEQMTVLARTVSLPQWPTTVFLTLAGALAVWFSARLAEGAITSQVAAEQRLATQLWYLRHLIPKEAHEAASIRVLEPSAE